jgi:alkaline phosphatase D
LSAGVVIWAGAQAGEAEARFAVNSTRSPGSVFPQSVASGDPRPGGIVLWTRLANLGRGTTVAYQIARDSGFKNVVLGGTARTSTARDNTVKVQLNRPDLLRPDTHYYYRFIYGGTASRTGRFRTLPAPGARLDDVRFGYISCQDYTNGYYTALGYLANENIDFVVHLGDYIYETVDEASFQGGGPEARRIPASSISGGEADTLADYRFLYKKYKTDRNLQRLHERFAFITIWDDHEFANDAYRTVAPDAETGTRPVPARREAATRAWAEYTATGVPYDPSRGPLDEIRLYRSFVFGDLMELVMTDERLYRDGPPAGNELQDRYLTPGGKGEDSPKRTILGRSPDGTVNRSPQKQFFLDKMLGSRRIWKIWGNEVTFMQFKVLNTFLDAGLFPGVPAVPDGVYVTLDQWDGFQAERDEIIRLVRRRGVKNFVTITGDIHTFIAGYIREDFDDPLAVPQGPNLNAPPPPDAVGVEFVCGSVTSSNLYELASLGQGRVDLPGDADTREDISAAFQSSNNRHFKYFNSRTHGYNLITVTREKLTCTMKAVSTINSPQATLSTLKTFEVPVNRTEIIDTSLPRL